VKLPEDAVEILASKGIKASKRWADVWGAEHACAFAVAQMTRIGQLSDVQQALVQSLEDGTTKEQFIKRLGPLLEEKGWMPKGRGGDIPYRLSRIYDINRRTARAAGHWSRIQKTKEILPYLLYVNGPSWQRCPDHVALAGVCLPVDDEWWGSHFPSNGWGCKCFVLQVSRTEQARLKKAGKIQSESPPVQKEEWIDPVTREVKMVTKGIDPSWDYHIGKAPWRDFTPATDREANRIIREFGIQAGKKWAGLFLQSPGFRDFTTTPAGARVGYGAPLGVLPDMDDLKISPVLQEYAEEIAPLLEMIRGNSPILLLKHSTAYKQIESRKGEEFSWTEYQKVQTLLEEAEYFNVYDEGDSIRLAGFAEYGRRGYAFAWDFEKRTKRNVLVTLHGLGEDPKEWDGWKGRATKSLRRRLGEK